MSDQSERGDTGKMASFLNHIVHFVQVLRLYGGDIGSISRDARNTNARVLRLYGGDIGSLCIERCAHNGAGIMSLCFTSGLSVNDDGSVTSGCHVASLHIGRRYLARSYCAMNSRALAAVSPLGKRFK